MSLETKVQYLFYFSLFMVSALTLGGAIWAYGDARKRKKSPLLVALLVFWLLFPAGLIAWLVFRPALPGTRAPTGSDPDGDLKRRANEGRL